MQENSSFRSDWLLLLKIDQSHAFFIQKVSSEYAQST